MKKYGPSAHEIKDLEADISSLTTSDLNIFTQLGTPLKKDELMINIFFLESDNSEFKVFPFKFINLDKFIIQKSKTVQELKKDIIKLHVLCCALNSNFPNCLGISGNAWVFPNCLGNSRNS